MQGSRSVSVALLTALLTVLLAVAGADTATGAAQEPLTPGASHAMVRFVNAAPNAVPARVLLSDAMGTIELEDLAGLAFGEASDYVQVLAGSYDVSVSLAVVEGAQTDPVLVPAEALDTFAGEFYTIALIGLVHPAEAETADDGFLAWLERLFTTDADDLTLRARVIGDLVTTALPQHETEVRIMHAAPGTDAVDLVLVHPNDVEVLGSASFGDLSAFSRLIPAEGRLEVRIAGSDAPLVDLGDEPLATGISHTIFLTGTPIEQVPLEAIVEPNPWVAADAIPPATPGAVTPAAATLTATEMVWMRDSMIEVERRLASIESRLATLADVEGAEDEVQAALQEVDEAMAFLVEARAQLEAQPALPPTEAPLPPEPAEGAEPAGAAD